MVSKFKMCMFTNFRCLLLGVFLVDASAFCIDYPCLRNFNERTAISTRSLHTEPWGHPLSVRIFPFKEMGCCPSTVIKLSNNGPEGNLVHGFMTFKEDSWPVEHLLPAKRPSLWSKKEVWAYHKQWCIGNDVQPDSKAQFFSGQQYVSTAQRNGLGICFEVGDVEKASALALDILSLESEVCLEYLEACFYYLIFLPLFLKFDAANDDDIPWSQDAALKWTSTEVQERLMMWAVKRSVRLTAKVFGIDGSKLREMAKAPQEFASLFAYASPADFEDLQSKMMAKKDPLYTATQMVEVERMFTLQYRDPYGMVSRFVEYTHKVVDAFQANPQRFFAPYFPLVQSSGSGMSRLLLEVSRVVRTMYVCFRPIGSNGYPVRTTSTIAALFPSAAGVPASEYEAAFDSRLHLIVKSARTNLPDPATTLLSSGNFASEEHATDVWDLKAVAKTSDPANEDLVLLVIDEARELASETIFGVSKFRYLRRRLRECGTKLKLCAVFVDTSSRIDVFSSIQSKDPSSRPVQEEGGGELFHPFILISNDVLFNGLPMGANDLSSLVNSQDYLSAGRPLVSTPLVGMSDREHLDFLLRKLKGGSSEMSESGALSIGLCRLAMNINRQSSNTADLVAEHMAHLLACDLSRESIVSAYIAEPRLAAAAASAWNENTLVEHILPALQKAMLKGSVSGGAIGEIVLQVVLLRAFDAACAKDKQILGGAVRLSSVLEQLLPKDWTINIFDAIPQHLHNVHVACCGFQKLCKDLDPSDLTLLAERHYAALFKDGQAGVDAIFQLLAKDPAVMVVQGKNSPEDKDMQTASAETGRVCIRMMPSAFLKGQYRFTKAETDALDAGCVRVLLQVGAENTSAVCMDVKESKRSQIHVASAKPLQIFGLGSRCIGDALRSALETLLLVSLDLESFMRPVSIDAGLARFPMPFDVESVRKGIPFLISRNPQWSDHTYRELRVACTGLGLSFKFKSKSTKSTLLNLLQSYKYDGYLLMKTSSNSAPPMKTWESLTVPELQNKCRQANVPWVRRDRKDALISKLKKAGVSVDGPDQASSRS